MRRHADISLIPLHPSTHNSREGSSFPITSIAQTTRGRLLEALPIGPTNHDMKLQNLQTNAHLRSTRRRAEPNTLPPPQSQRFLEGGPGISIHLRNDGVERNDAFREMV